MNLLNTVAEKYKNMSTPVKASFWFTICSIFQKGISFITVPIFTRILSTEEYGVYSLYLSWQNIISIFATLNLSYQVFNNGMVKYENDQPGYTTAMLGLSNLSTIIVFGIYFLFHDFINKITGMDGKYFILMFFFFIFSTATSLWTVQQRYLFRYKALCMVIAFTSVGTSLLGIIFTYNSPTGYSKILADTFITCMVGAGIYFLLIRKNRNIINTEYWKYALILDLPLIMHYLSMSVLGSVDRIMINSMCGSGYTALYSVPYNASMIMKIIISSINASFIPWTYQKCKSKSWTDINKNSTYILILVGIMTIIPALFAPELVWLLGSEKYYLSAWIVPPVSCSVFFIFLYSLFSNIELYFGNSKNIMYASFITSVVNIVLNYIFINKFGYIAAAYTTLFCYILLSVFHYIFMKKTLKNNNTEATPYNMKIIIMLSLVVCIYSIAVGYLYTSHTLIRYFIILVSVSICAIYFKKHIID